MSDAALGLLEISSIARGLVVADALVKKAPVRLQRCYTVSPGKHLTLLAGGVDEVFESLSIGKSLAAHFLLHDLFLPQIDRSVLAAIEGRFATTYGESLAIIESFAVASTILAADAACKAADVSVHELHLAMHLGGKGYFVLSGELNMIQTAVAAGLRAMGTGFYCNHEIIAAPHPELLAQLQIETSLRQSQEQRPAGGHHQGTKTPRKPKKT